MKKLIAVVVIALSFSFSANAIQFDHWSVNKDSISNFGTWEDGTRAGIIVYDDASTLVVVNPKGGDFGTVVHEEKGELFADGQPLKATVVWYSSGAVAIAPNTNKGNTFLTNKLWAQKKVSFKFKEFEFWISAKGVQKAWRYLKSVKQAI